MVIIEETIISKCPKCRNLMQSGGIHPINEFEDKEPLSEFMLKLACSNCNLGTHVVKVYKKSRIL